MSSKLADDAYLILISVRFLCFAISAMKIEIASKIYECERGYLGTVGDCCCYLWGCTVRGGE